MLPQTKIFDGRTRCIEKRFEKTRRTFRSAIENLFGAHRSEPKSRPTWLLSGNVVSHMGTGAAMVRAHSAAVERPHDI